MMIIEDLKHEMSLRNISRISGISLSGYYYRPVKRHIQRLDPSTRARIKDIASERPAYGYRRVWAILRNQGTAVNQKTVRKVLKNSNLSLPASKHRGRTKTRNLFKPTGPDQLWETDITYCFTKEWQGYHTIHGEYCSDGIQWNGSRRSRNEDRQRSPVHIA